MSITIDAIPNLSDNYCYLIHLGDDAWLVDPGEAAPLVKALDERGATLRGILLTHHHWDHVGGVGGLLEKYGQDDIWVAGHVSDRDRIEHQSHFVEAPRGRFVGTGLKVGDTELLGMHIPGHTMGAIAWLLPDAPVGHCFTGDTLFAAGCGRLFEGTPADMHGSLKSICELPGDTKLWFGHEYTASNLRYAVVAEPGNVATRSRAADLAEVTTPTTVTEELATNPFLRAGDATQMGERRAAKDNFTG